MRLSTLCMATLLAVGAVGIAHATPNLVLNGNFSNQSSTTNPAQFGSNSGGGTIFGTGSCTYGGQTVANWTGNGGYLISYPDLASTSTEPCTQWSGETQTLSPINTTGLPAGTTDVSFVGMDGIDSPIPHGSISQTINGLTSGAKYTVSFYWGNTQLLNRTGDTTEYLTVSLGGQSFDTVTNSIGTHGWSDWAPVSFTFTPDSSTGAGWNVLSFLSVGTPNSLPPFAVLTGVSMTQNVPEPPELAMFGSGLLGLGLLIVFARRREMRRRATDGNSAIV